MIREILTALGIEPTIGWLIIIILVGGLIEISPIKLNPWSFIKNILTTNKKILEAIEDVNKQVTSVNDRVTSLEAEMLAGQKRREEQRQEDLALRARCRIIEFGDGVSHRHEYSEERYNQIIDDIDFYEKYCLEHPTYKNSKAKMNIAIIKKAYEQCMNGEREFWKGYDD